MTPKHRTVAAPDVAVARPVAGVAFPLPPARRADQPGRVPPAPGECHLWLIPVRRHAGWLHLLDREERRQADRLAGSPAGDILVTSRGAQRLIGSGYLGVPPAAVLTDRSCPYCATPDARHGRPRFRAASIDYSVSHTERWMIMAVAGSGHVGADIEDLVRAPDTDGLARTVLTAAEQRSIECLAGVERAAWLLSAWTRKEAAMKLTGLGLRAPPNRVDVSGAKVSAAAVPRWPVGEIHLYGLGAPPGHVSALATTVPVRTLHRYELSEARS